MIHYKQGNLLEAEVDALVNTVNTVGVMGKGIALMFKERFKENFKQYARACKDGEVVTGRMHVTRTGELSGPKWIINFPTKQHWRKPTRIEWVEEGLQDLKATILSEGIRSIALPPLGCGNGGLKWTQVKPLIEAALGDLEDVKIIAYEPTSKYQNVAKRNGVKTITPARALMFELIRRYWVLDVECTILEVQKLGWFAERSIQHLGLENELDFQFAADKFGPFSTRLNHLLDSMDGSFLKCDKRLPDASPYDAIWYNPEFSEAVSLFLKTKAKDHLRVIEETERVIDGFQTPFGMELLSTVDWLVSQEKCDPSLEGIRTGINRWKIEGARERKNRIFDDRTLGLAIKRLAFKV